MHEKATLSGDIQSMEVFCMVKKVRSEYFSKWQFLVTLMGYKLEHQKKKKKKTFLFGTNGKLMVLRVPIVKCVRVCI